MISFTTIDAADPVNIPDQMRLLAKGMLDLVDGLESDAKDNYPIHHPMRVAMFETAHCFLLNAAALKKAAEGMANA
jgi:hypothetical protein